LIDRSHFQLAIKKEPDWAQRYAGLADVGNYQKQMGFKAIADVLPVIKMNLEKALELDPNAANTHYSNAVNAVWTEFDWKKGEKEFNKAIDLNPNFAYARLMYAHLLMILRRTEEALSQAKIGEELEPLDPFIKGLYADVLKRTGNCEAAKIHAEKGLSIEPNHFFALNELLGSYECSREYEKAFEIKKHYPLWEKFGVAEFMDSVFHKKGWIALLQEEIKLYEKNERQNYFQLFLRYLEVGKPERSIDYMEQLYKIRSPTLPYISAIDHYNVLKDHPRYITLLKELNLPTD